MQLKRKNIPRHWLKKRIARGDTIEKMAAARGVSVSTIRKRLKDYGLQTNRTRVRGTAPDLIRRAEVMYAGGRTFREIGDAIGVSRHTVARWGKERRWAHDERMQKLRQEARTIRRGARPKPQRGANQDVLDQVEAGRELVRKAGLFAIHKGVQAIKEAKKLPVTVAPPLLRTGTDMVTRSDGWGRDDTSIHVSVQTRIDSALTLIGARIGQWQREGRITQVEAREVLGLLPEGESDDGNENGLADGEGGGSSTQGETGVGVPPDSRA